jgi:hypothetical protein
VQQAFKSRLILHSMHHHSLATIKSVQSTNVIYDGSLLKGCVIQIIILSLSAEYVVTVMTLDTMLRSMLTLELNGMKVRMHVSSQHQSEHVRMHACMYI